MKYYMYSIFDRVAQTYSNPFCSINDQDATRSFARAVNDSNTSICAAPHDYSLYLLAEWHALDGVISALDRPAHVCNGDALVAVVNSNNED